MRLLKTGGIPLPEIYICTNSMDAMKLKGTGIPYIITKLDDLDIVKLILRTTLERKFPHIDWKEVLGIKTRRRLNVIVSGSTGEPIDDMDDRAIDDTSDQTIDDIDDRDDSPFEVDNPSSCEHEVSEIASSDRNFGGVHGYTGTNEERIPVDEYCADEAASVNIEQLQELGLLPKFMDDIATAIRMNLEGSMRWMDSWNKRLGACVGNMVYTESLPNLIILDVSWSIPEGISATMLELIETLRDRAEADLIVTGGTSKYWSRDEELPSPSAIRGMIPRSNESTHFAAILREKISGRKFGNVISFGDYDNPYCYGTLQGKDLTITDDFTRMFGLQGTEVKRCLHYHTTHRDRTGYAKWCKAISPGCEEVFDNTWCRVMR